MTRHLSIAVLALAVLIGVADAQTRIGVSPPDPYVLQNAPLFLNANTNGYTNVSSVPPDPTHTAVIITVGQSLVVGAAAGTYSVVNSGALNFNIYDGGTYSCKNPVLGTQSVPSLSPNGNSPNCIIADQLITNGIYTHVIMVPIAVGGTLCSDWQPGGLWNERIGVTMSRLASRNLTTATGFTGDFWILYHQGENDNQAGTPRATLATCIRNIAQLFVNAGSGSARFFVPQAESIAANVVGANVVGAQADAVATGCTTCRAGSNWDSLTGGTNRQADGTHLTQASNLSAATMDVSIITNCKSTFC